MREVSPSQSHGYRVLMCRVLIRAYFYINLHRRSLTYAVLTFPKVRCKSELSTHTVKCTYVFGSPHWNPNSTTLEPNRLQYDLPTACVIAQQYFSAISVSLRIHSRKEKFDATFKKSLCQFFPFLKFARVWNDVSVMVKSTSVSSNSAAQEI